MRFGAVLVLGLSPVQAGGDEPPPYTSATEAYRQGTSSLKSGQTAASLPALEYAAKRGVLGAQLKLARIYATGRDSVAEDDSKAFGYFQQIADQQADISPSSPIAKYAAEAFVALGQYYADGIPAMQLARNPVYAVDLFRHAASYFGDAEAQYRLARLYMNGDGVEKNVGLAVNWLATAAKKQHRGRASHARRDSVARPGCAPAPGEGACPDHSRPPERASRAARSRNGSATSIARRSTSPTLRRARMPRRCCRNWATCKPRT